MTLDVIQNILGWCALINFGVLLFWAAWLIFAHDFIYKIHSAFIKIPVEKYDALNYQLMGLYKILVIVFNVVPYLALRFIT